MHPPSCFALSFAHFLNSAGRNPFTTLLNKISPLPSLSKSHISRAICMNSTYRADSLLKIGRVSRVKKAECVLRPSTYTAVTCALIVPMNRMLCPLYTVRSVSSPIASRHMSDRERYWSLKLSSTCDAAVAGLSASTGVSSTCVPFFIPKASAMCFTT
ncbi:hypothetical protein N0V92_005226 [Colletotrichum tropicale]|nr:hypothetical protein N0V92_005226 [Colletotrichum tropicale]